MPMSLPPPSPDNDTAMPLWQHLDELRGVLIRCLVAVMVSLCVTYYFSEQLVLFLEQPLLDILPEGQQRLYFTGITDKFFVYLQVSIICAIFLASPYLFYQLWKFIAPGLKANERRFAIPFVTFATFTFALGLSFSYYIVIPYGYKFLIEFAGTGDHAPQAMITLNEYFSLTLKLMLAIGAVFEVPVLLVLLGKLGIIDAPLLSKNRRFAFVVSAIVSAIATPSPDAFTMLLVMGPLYLLYEVSIIGVRWVTKAEEVKA